MPASRPHLDFQEVFFSKPTQWQGGAPRLAKSTVFRLFLAHPRYTDGARRAMRPY
jgi:hypothetical protein